MLHAEESLTKSGKAVTVAVEIDHAVTRVVSRIPAASS